MNSYVTRVLNDLKAKCPWEKEFIQAATEVLESLSLVMDQEPRYEEHKILERIVIPERIIQFRVEWLDDSGEVQVDNGYRVQFNSAIGPYKGGLRFHPSVNLGILKFLGFEQIFKNSLTSLPMGGGKGGSDFDPKGRSDAEIMKFCQAFMRELYRHIGPDTDVPAGDIGVGGREIGYLFGQYKKISNRHQCVLTGKALNWGGSLVRPEATGFGATYFAKEMLSTIDKDFDGKTVLVSGFGNVAWGAVQKITELGGKVVTLSGPDGFIWDKEGINTQEKWNYMLEIRMSGRDVVKPYAERFGCEFFANERPWKNVKADIAMPCATQNEIDGEDAAALIANGCYCVCEGANMPSDAAAVELFLEKGILFGPGKAANAGGVATSGLEMSQNAMRLNWSAEEVDNKLHEIMINIHSACAEAAEEYGTPGNYVNGANIAGFKKVADAMIDLGL